MKTLFLALFLVTSAFAFADEYYWQIGKVLSKSGEVRGTTLVLGHRSYDAAAARKTDSQIYVSKDEGPVEYSYVFDSKTSLMEISSGGKKVGHGKFKCRGRLESNPHCDYEYQVTEGSAYSAKGSDQPVNKKSVLFRERAEMLYPSEPGAPVLWEADYLSTDQATYDKMKALIFAQPATKK